jgi:ABC-type antimicrobial peptide transport system ATPase subunit
MWGQRPSVVEFNAVMIIRDVHITIGINTKADTVVNVNGFELTFNRGTLNGIVAQIAAHHSKGSVRSVIGRELPVAVSNDAVMTKDGRINGCAGICITEFENTRRFQIHA